jgi:N-acetylneuraminate synthase
MINPLHIGDRQIGPHQPVYVVAEMSGNHGQDFNQAVEIIRMAKQAGADAVKLQTYTPDTLTINSSNEVFKVSQGTIWQGRTLYDLYSEAYTPWEWQPKLKQVANDLGLQLFSTPFDDSSVDFLLSLDIPVFKVASFEVVDLPLLKRIASTGKPIIMSTGMATLSEIDEAVRAVQSTGNNAIALLKCTSAYPAPPEEMNLRTIPFLSEAFEAPVGLSDHTLGIAVAVAAVSLGACIIEKHFTLSRANPGPDSEFSLEPHEFKAMVEAIRTTEKALGNVDFSITPQENLSRVFRRSLFVVKNINQGEKFTNENIRSIRPANGLPPKFLDAILGRHASKDIEFGTPLQWDLVQ